MGMASSQARLLSLTARMHDIEYKAQKLQAQKLQMANKSTDVYNEYEEALNKTKVQYKTIGADGSANYIDASIKNLVTATGEAKSSYIVHNIFENVMYCTAEQIAAYTDAAGDPEKFAEEMGDAHSVSYKELYEEMASCVAKHGGVVGEALINVAAATGMQAQQFASEEYLTNMVNAGFIVFRKMNADNVTAAAEQVNVATDTALQEVSDEKELKKAEAKYEADMRKINAKDKRFDVDIAALEQERNAIKTEMDTLKTVAKDNVERTFKLFG